MPKVFVVSSGATVVVARGTNVTRIRGVAISATAPTAGQALVASSATAAGWTDIATQAEMNAHLANLSNPHAVTKAQVGLGNVENTALSTWAGSAYIATVAQAAVTAHQAALSIGIAQLTGFGAAGGYLRSDGNAWVRASGVAWADLTGVPSTFTPAAHTHPLSDLTGFGAAGGYVRSDGAAWQRVSGVAWGDLTGVPSTFAPSAHSHPASQVTAGTFAAGVYSFAGSTINGQPTWGSAQAMDISGNAATATSATSAGTATLASTVTVADTTSATCSVALFEAATGSLAAKTDAGLTYNATTGVLTATGFAGALSGNASTATALATPRAINGVNFDGSAAITVPVNNADDTTTNATMYPLWTATAGGNYAAKVSTTKLSFNPSTGILTATGFSGALNGTVGATTPAAGAFTTVNIGGTGAPGAACEILVDNSIMANLFLTDSRSYATNVGGQFWFRGKYNSGGSLAYFGSFYAVKENATDGNTAGYMRFYVNNGTGSTNTVEYLRITSAGNVAQAATSKHYFDGVAATGDTYITESSANVLDLYAGGAKQLSLTATTATVAGNLIVSGAGPHAIGSATGAGQALRLAGAFTNVATIYCRGLSIEHQLTLAAGTTANASHLRTAGTVTTQNNSETIGIIASAYFAEPDITKGATDTVTLAATVYIANQPTEGTSNYALYVAGGVGITGQFIASSSSGAHAIGQAADGRYSLVISGARTSSGSDSDAAVMRVNGTITGASGDTAQLAGTWISCSVTTQATDTVAVVAQLALDEPNITVGSGGAVTAAATLYIKNAPTEGASNYALFVDAGASRFDGTCYIGDSANANATLGLTINQGAADDEILAFKSSDVAHGLTTYSETDTYAAWAKQDSALGGFRFRVFAEDAALSTVYNLSVFGGTADTTKSTAGRALVETYVTEHNGANALADITADGNVWGVRCRRGGADVTLALLDEDADLWLGGALTTNLGLQTATANDSAGAGYRYVIVPNA
jgi:hypothetical protein